MKPLERPDMASALVDRAVFVSASIPDATRWSGEFDDLEITDAVVAVARALLTAGASIVTAAHPTIAPLLLYVAAELPDRDRLRVVVYQSLLYENLMPQATRRFEAEGIGTLVPVMAVEGDEPEPGKSDSSLELMRRRMLIETEPVGAVFIGGMEGIPLEYRLFGELFPGRPRYPIGRPGGEARELSLTSESPLRERLAHEIVYPALARAIVYDLEEATAHD
jgi:SLOG cluster3 family